MIPTPNIRTNEEEADRLSLLSGQGEEAFGRIFQKYWSELYDFAYLKTQDTDVAEEIVQELFVHLWEKRETLRIANLRSYLFVSVKNRVIDHFRQTTHARLDSMIDLPAAATYPLFLEELESALGDALAQLPEKSQQIFCLKRFEDKSTREIAEQLAIPERTVEHHYTQATRTLRSLLSSFLSVLIWLYFTCIF